MNECAEHNHVVVRWKQREAHQPTPLYRTALIVEGPFQGLFQRLPIFASPRPQRERDRNPGKPIVFHSRASYAPHRFGSCRTRGRVSFSGRSLKPCPSRPFASSSRPKNVTSGVSATRLKY